MTEPGKFGLGACLVAEFLTIQNTIKDGWLIHYFYLVLHVSLEDKYRGNVTN
jgi:hypothetical protein